MIDPIHNFLNECFFIYYKCYIMMLIRQKNEKSVIFVTIGIFQIKVLSFNQMSAIDVIIY